MDFLREAECLGRQARLGPEAAVGQVLVQTPGDSVVKPARRAPTGG